MEFIGIIIISLVIGTIIPAMLKNPSVKKYVDDVKSKLKSSKQPENSKYKGLAEDIKDKSSLPPYKAKKSDFVSMEGAESSEGKGTEGYSAMKSSLTEMHAAEYKSLKSRNEYLEEHNHPATESGDTKEREPYYGSLNVDYAGEGCKDHRNLAYISDAPGITRDRIKLTTLQKIIVFGDMINTPAYKRRNAASFKRLG